MTAPLDVWRGCGNRVNSLKKNRGQLRDAHIGANG